MTWNVGDRVRHDVMPEWGLGEVLEVAEGDRVRVQFEHAGAKLLRSAPLTRAAGADARRPLLTKRVAKAATQGPRRSMDEYKQAFRSQFPGGFADPGYVRKEREYKLAAVSCLAQTLAKDELGSLVLAGDMGEVCKRALKVLGQTNLAHPHEKMALRDGLKAAEAKSRFSSSLFDLLYGSAGFADRFSAFSGVLGEIGAAKWPIATYFPFLAEPAKHVFLKPTATQHIADACGMELNYRTEPNPLTYECFLRLSDHLLVILRDLKPTDMIDVQSFIWCVAG